MAGRHLNHFNIYYAPEPRLHAEWQNRMQRLAESTRLGIPVTISSDPRHSFAENLGASWSAGGFSHWPEPIGFGALRDEQALQEFGDIARREYRAVGIHVALHPMADLATEPRWARIMHTFGEDAELAGRLVAAYIRGFQGDAARAAIRRVHDQALPRRRAAAGRRGPPFPVRQGSDLSRRDVRLPPARVRGRVRGGNGADHAVLRTPGRHTVRGGRLRLQPRRDQRAPARALRLRRSGLHRLGPRHRRPDAGRLGVRGQVLGRRGAECGGSAREDRGRGLRPARRRGAAGAARGARPRGPHRGIAPRRVRAPSAARQVPPRPLRRPVRRSRGGRAHLRLLGVSRRRRSPAAAVCGGRDERRHAAARGPAASLPRRRLGRAPLQPSATSSSGRRMPMSRSSAGMRPSSRVSGASSRASSTPATSTSRSRSSAGCSSSRGACRRCWCCTSSDLRSSPSSRRRAQPSLAVFGSSDDAVLDVLFGRVAPEGRLPFELPSSMEAARAQKPDVPGDSRDPLFRFGHGLAYG